jgi:hypothetical protein
VIRAIVPPPVARPWFRTRRARSHCRRAAPVNDGAATRVRIERARARPYVDRGAQGDETMYHAIVGQLVRSSLERLSQGDYSVALTSAAPGAHHVFADDHAVGGERHGRDAFRRWFERLFRLFPGLRFRGPRGAREGLALLQGGGGRMARGRHAGGRSVLRGCARRASPLGTCRVRACVRELASRGGGVPSHGGERDRGGRSGAHRRPA